MKTPTIDKALNDIPLEHEFIEVIGAREHNLKNISVNIPRNKLVVITGLSGSGKSSLAFDTIYAEGQRRYIETLSAYARQFLGSMERPDVDKIDGLSPVISIEQKTVNKNPRSTVGTITEIYDFLRLLFARTGEAFSYVTGEKMVRFTEQQIIDLIIERFAKQKIQILAPVVKGRKGHYRELFEQLRKSGFSKVRIDGDMKDIRAGMQADRYSIHDIEVLIDRIDVSPDSKRRIAESISLGMKHGKGVIMVIGEDHKAHHYSRFLMCPTSGISYDEPAPNLFSFNSPYGACPHCNGLGEVSKIDVKKIIPETHKSINDGAIVPVGKRKDNWIFRQLEAIGEKHNFTLDTPVNKLSEEAVHTILYGTDEILKIRESLNSTAHSYALNFEGIVNFIERQRQESDTPGLSDWVAGFMNKVTCLECKGARLKKEALYFKIDGKNIAELASLDINVLYEWLKNTEVTLTAKNKVIAKEVFKELRSRTEFLLNVGLDYLTLNRSSKTLSGGEAQRIRLATQIGSQLVGVLYILDEPSIGLHQRDNTRLIHALQQLRDIGNSVIVVEHDKEMMLASDWVIDIGPGTGMHGGKVVAEGVPKKFLEMPSLTADFLKGRKEIAVPKVRRKGSGKEIVLKGAKGHNLKNVNITFPLGKLICVTGVSGGGKSTLINETLYPIISHHLYKSEKKPLEYSSITGIQNIDKIIEIDQAPIGRTPRSNPATYVNVFADIRNLFAALPESKIRGYQAGRFSFNVKGGRCETCQGAGLQTIEMNFLPDVYVVCNTCNGKRYNRETLEVRYKGKSINDVLNLTVEQAVEFFSEIPSIFQKITTLNQIGLGYVTLGQSSTTLSGGEAQRTKLATELSKKQTGNTLYILDEPTTGLHFEDIRLLLDVLNKLVDYGNTVIVIEHNLDVIKVADHIIDLGPEGGSKGGYIVAEGTPEELIKNKKSHTAVYLAKEL
ncbi:MAG TPA: excinuclease ABC subunit UvrA [Bacteroidia bacterium]|nr:excinuclease ABC subunit UvrA [Bacteroidia bacterium]